MAPKLGPQKGLYPLDYALKRGLPSVRRSSLGSGVFTPAIWVGHSWLSFAARHALLSPRLVVLPTNCYRPMASLKRKSSDWCI